MFQAAKAVITAGLICGLGSAHANGVLYQPIPSRYDKPHSNLHTIFLTPSQVAAVCSTKSGRVNHKTVACAVGETRFGPGEYCIVFLPHGTRRSSYLFRHEQAHCNGWPISHPSK